MTTFFTATIIAGAIVTPILIGRELYLTYTILRLVREIDQVKGQRLTSWNVPVFEKINWINPFRFRAFIRANESLGDARLDLNLSKFRRNHRAMIICGVALMTSFYGFRVATFPA
jgi:hypothetical protein